MYYFSGLVIVTSLPLQASDAKHIIHSDRGANYRIPDWINLMEEYGYLSLTEYRSRASL